MKKFLSVAMTVALVALCSSAYAGQIWTDGNGDGLPDGGPAIVAPPSSNVTVGVWIDAQSFTWTNFLAFIEWPASQCISYVSASYTITGGSTFPIDNFSNPRAVGFGGSGFNQGGVDQIGNATFHINTNVSCCVSPIISTDNPYYTFSQLGSGAAYMLFSTAGSTCYNDVQLPTGACCLPDFSCIPNITASECAAAGGTQWNQGQPCSSCPPPPQFNACCFPDGSCVDAQVGQCPAGSTPQAVGTACATFTCQDIRPREACCFPDGSCIVAILGSCPAGSTPQGAGSTCSPNICPQPPVLGACCRSDGSCADNVPQSDCPPPDGTWYPNTPCSQVDCGGTAVEPTSWGNIKGLYR
jgi:hypothetical protein